MAKVTKPPSPDHLTMNLFAPGMSALHRAGLGGLACTLKAMERQFKDGLLPKTKLPAPFVDDVPPWVMDEQTLTLHFGKPENAGNYLKKLFGFAFGIRKDGLISLPGQYDAEPAAAVLADLQAGFTLTFLQHGRVRALAKEPTTVSYDPENEGVPGVVVQYKQCSGFKHQKGWEEFIDKNGCLSAGPIKVDGPLSPGTVVRHVAFTGDTGAEDPPERMLPLYFALVGCLSLPVNRGVAALLVPDVTDLTEFVYDRPAMTPTTATECQIGNAADAAFRAQVRVRKNARRTAEVHLRAKKSLAGSALPGCYAMTFMPTPWASQQKSRVATILIPPGDDRVLDRYERAASHLRARIKTRIIKEATGKGRARITTERQESFRTDSIVRPLIAENLALGRKWYAGFSLLMTKTNPATGKPYRDQLNFPEERKGLHAMIADKGMWDETGERLVVQAVHEAMRMRYGQIADENQGNSAAMKNRMKGFREKLRLDLAGAKTEVLVRFALMDLFSRGGSNGVLREGWQKVLPIIRKDWRLARDLGLLALVSYAGKGLDENENQAEPK
jgi:CRISPR-associated protein Cas8a1/Csx13